MMLIKQEIRSMKQPYSLRPAVCEIKVYEGIGTATGKFVVVATDIGHSSVVANGVEQIATGLKKLVFVERRRRTESFEETFDAVHLVWNERENKYTAPNWSPVSRESNGAITGENFE